MMYQISSGIISSGIILGYHDSMTISSGGTVNETTVNDGYMDIYSGGTANSTTVNDGGVMYISSGGTANSTTVNSDGYMGICSGGTANSTTVNDWGYMVISSGGTATDIEVMSGGRLGLTVALDTYIQGTSNGSTFEMKNAFIEGYTVNSNRYMYISSGATANRTTANDGVMYIFSGGTANNTTINNGYMDIFSGGTANNTTINNGYMWISSGGTANNTTVVNYGRMYIYSGGTANSTTVNSDGYMGISTGGTANNTTVNSNGKMGISSGGTAHNTTVNSSGHMGIFSGGKHCGTLKMETGAVVSAYSEAIIDFTVADRTVEDDYLINNLALIKGAPTYTITVSADQAYGTYKLAQGASALNGSITICTQDTCFGTLTINGDVLTYSSKTYSLIQNSGNLQLIISGCGSQVKIYSSGSLVKQGTEFTGETIGYGGNNSMTISSGGTANDTRNSGGKITISSGGTVNETTVYSGGTIYIYTGGTANNTTVNLYGWMYIKSGGTANRTTVNDGDIRISSGGTANSTTINSGGSMIISSGGTANNTIVNSSGYMVISSGGTVNYAAVNFWGNMSISSGGTANNTIVNSSGDMVINTGGTANNTTVNVRGYMSISSGGTANSTIIKSSGGMNITSGGTANNTTVNEGAIYIYSGGTVNNTTVNPFGTLWVSSDGTANSTTINYRGYMYISSGGKHCGSLQIESGATVTAYSEAIIDFTVADRTVEDDYLINNLALIEGAPTYTITVSADQEAGTYKLAQGAEDFEDSITICTQDTCFGELTINGEALTYNDITYQLNNADGALTLTVSNGNVVVESEPIFAFGKFNGLGGMFELTVDGVGYVHNAYTKLQLNGTLDSTKWEVVGVADFNKSGTDGLLWQEKDTGYVYMQNNLTSFDEVNNKQYCLGVVGEGYEILAAGDFTGTGINGVIMQGPAFGDASVSLNYGLPIWGREADGSTFNGWLGALVNTWQPGDVLKGDTSDLADINAKNYMYEVVSVGDYNGDGVDDVMLQNVMPTTVNGVTITGSGDVFTFLTGDMNAVKAGAAPTVAYAGCATGGWEIMGSGDFNGDGIDDVLLSDGTGVAGWQMMNGQQAGNQWFGNLGASEEIAGITDLNNDGTDDIVVLNTATETYHGWMISNGAISYAVTLA